MSRRLAGCFAASAPRTEITLASDEFFKALTVSLPKAGIMVRMACGAMIRRISNPGVMPSAWPASDLSAVDAEHAGAQHFSDEGRLIGSERQPRRSDRART